MTWRRPRLLDLYCGAGGAAVGYARAGFDVVGVDHVAQPRYPFPMIVGDALDAVIWAGCFDAIHASPPCQHASKLGKQRRRGGVYDHPDLIPATRERLQRAGVPYVLENVAGAALTDPVVLCGSWFGLDVQRHRHFETTFPALSTPCSHHWQAPRFPTRHRGHAAVGRVVGVHGHTNYAGEHALRERAMDIDWMTPRELAQAIPPAYTEYLGALLLEHVQPLGRLESPA